MSNKWFPWGKADAEVPAATNGGLPITEPPCKTCLSFKPEVTFRMGRDGQIPDGVRICHAPDMHHDFSCYRAEASDE